MLVYNETKSQQKIDGQNHPKGEKKGRPKNGQKMHSPKVAKRGKKLVFHGRKLFHP
jgi:hypothetical protein